MTEWLPAFNACLNATSALLLVAGYRAIRRRDVARHRACMVGALGVSALFLASYLTYHALHGSTSFPATGPIRIFYMTILGSHSFLAVVLLPMVLVTVRRGLKDDRSGHRALACVTLPIWLYVSVTGVLVYLLLYHVGPRLA